MSTTNTQATGVAYADPSFVSVQVGSSTVPVSITSAGVLNGSYATTSATGGDTRLDYKKLIFTAAGSGETLRAYTSVASGAGAVADLCAGHLGLDPVGYAHRLTPDHEVFAGRSVRTPIGLTMAGGRGHISGIRRQLGGGLVVSGF